MFKQFSPLLLLAEGQGMNYALLLFKLQPLFLFSLKPRVGLFFFFFSFFGV